MITYYAKTDIKSLAGSYILINILKTNTLARQSHKLHSHIASHLDLLVFFSMIE